MPSAFEEYVLIMFKNKHFSNQMLIGNIYRSPNSAEENDNKLYELLNYPQNKFEVPILITGDFNYSHIEWYQDYGHGASAECSGLSDNDMKFINTLQQNFSFNI